MVTGKEIGSQIWLPEKKLVPKYGYRKRNWFPNMVTRKESVSQILLIDLFDFVISSPLKDM